VRYEPDDQVVLLRADEPNTEEYGEDVHAEVEAAGEQLAVASRAFQRAAVGVTRI
jgi:hypothetical protein